MRPFLKETEEGLVLTDGDLSVRGDFRLLLRRIKKDNLDREMLVRSVRGRNGGRTGNLPLEERPLVIDATAGLGEDSFLLAAAGFRVMLFERNPLIYALLGDSIKRALEDPELGEAASRMEAVEADFTEWVNASHRPESVEKPEAVFLDPMFPERSKSGLIKKKFQLLQSLESPCRSEEEEEELLAAARALNPKKIIIKRPLKGPELAGVKPGYSLKGSVIRYDIVLL